MRVGTIALAAALALPAAAHANVLVDATLNSGGTTLHVEFVTDVRHDTFDTSSFLVDTTNLPGVTVTDFSYSLLSTGSCHFGGGSQNGVAECFDASNSFGYASPLQATADPNVFTNPGSPSDAVLTFSATDLPVTGKVPEPVSLALFSAALAGLGVVRRTRWA